MTEHQEIRVVIADDSAPVREALRMLLEGHPRINIVGEAVDGNEAVRLAASLQPDLVLMDLRMPGLDGLEASRIILAERASTRVVMLSAHADPSWVSEATEIGIERYVYKGDSSTVVIAAVLGE